MKNGIEIVPVALAVRAAFRSRLSWSERWQRTARQANRRQGDSLQVVRWLALRQPQPGSHESAGSAWLLP